jgi:hypothetical protein
MKHFIFKFIIEINKVCQYFRSVTHQIYCKDLTVSTMQINVLD